MAFDVAEDGGLSNPRVHYRFAAGRGVDGMAIDVEGVLYGAAGDNKNAEENHAGVYVISSSGKLLGRIDVGEDPVTNCTHSADRASGRCTSRPVRPCTRCGRRTPASSSTRLWEMGISAVSAVAARISEECAWLEESAQTCAKQSRASWRSPGFTPAAGWQHGPGHRRQRRRRFHGDERGAVQGIPVSRRERQVLYIDTYEQGGGCCVSYPDFCELAIAGGVVLREWERSPTCGLLDDGGGFAESYSATQVSANAFQVLGRA